MPETLNPGGEPKPEINAQVLGEAIMGMAEDMREIADFCEALDRVLSRDEFQTSSGVKLVRVTPQRFIDAYNEERAIVDEGGDAGEPEPLTGPAP